MQERSGLVLKVQILEIWISPFKLFPKKSLNAKTLAIEREGVLLKVLKGSQSGYSQVFLWPELGDPSLALELDQARKENFSELFQRAMQLAIRDLKARASGESLLKNAWSPQSHFLCLPGEKPFPLISENSEQAWVKIKCKMHPHSWKKDLKAFQKFKKKKVKLRLDWNGSLSQSEFEDFCDKSFVYHDLFDWVEDPFPFDASAWKKLQQQLSFDLACDFAIPHLKSISQELLGCFNVTILKPSRQDEKAFLNSSSPLVGVEASSMRYGVTSSMDHAVSMAHTCSIFEEIISHPQVDSIGGLITHSVYEPDLFFSQIQVVGQRLGFPRGSGIGFDKELQSLSWEFLGQYCSQEV